MMGVVSSLGRDLQVAQQGVSTVLQFDGLTVFDVSQRLDHMGKEAGSHKTPSGPSHPVLQQGLGRGSGPRRLRHGVPLKGPFPYRLRLPVEEGSETVSADMPATCCLPHLPCSWLCPSIVMARTQSVEN